MAREAVLEARKVRKTYKLSGQVAYDALRGVSVRIERGERVAIVGPSGSGKSTLLNILGTLDRPTEGSVFVDGEDTARLSEVELARLRNKRIGFVFQNYGLISRMSALENVVQPLIPAGIPRREREHRGTDILARVGLAERIRNKPAQLSGGEQQRVAIARSIITSPTVLLADEPTGNLDTATGAQILSLLQGLHKDFGLTLVIVTHDPGFGKFSDRVIRIRDGRVEGEGLTPTAGQGVAL
ncbi:MAG: ABC transporter ATP-binding protein [Thermoplasmatota archaeon]